MSTYQDEIDDRKARDAREFEAANRRFLAEHGAKAFADPDGAGTQRYRGGRTTVDVTQVDARLGTVPDLVLAQEIGVCAKTIRLRRQALNVPAYRRQYEAPPAGAAPKSPTTPKRVAAGRPYGAQAARLRGLVDQLAMTRQAFAAALGVPTHILNPRLYGQANPAIFIKRAEQLLERLRTAAKEDVHVVEVDPVAPPPEPVAPVAPIAPSPARRPLSAVPGLVPRCQRPGLIQYPQAEQPPVAIAPSREAAPTGSELADAGQEQPTAAPLRDFAPSRETSLPAADQIEALPDEELRRLAELGISPAEFIAITDEWERTSARKTALIDRKIARIASPEELAELKRLKFLTEARAEYFAPLPLRRLEDLAIEALPDEELRRLAELATVSCQIRLLQAKREALLAARAGNLQPSVR